MLVEIRNLTKTYGAPDGGDAVAVLRGADLKLAAGETLSIVGPSGSGKSTLLNIIGALDRADSGEVLVEGRDIEKLSDADVAMYRNTTVGFIFQLHHLLPQCTILENVLIPTLARDGGDRTALRERATRLLESVGLTHRLHHRPGQLSGGERQRVAVARALINEPKLLLADEPTGALDRDNAAKLVDLILDISRKQGVAVMMVTHAPDLAKRMARAVELVDGKFEEVRGSSAARLP